MKLPRDVSGERLARALAEYGYAMTNRTGSHMRLTRAGDPEHHVTIPAHASLKAGTLNAVLKTVAAHLGKSRDDVIRELGL